MHGSEFTVVVIIGVALILGAVMRLVSAKTHFPFTIGMLLVGIAGGVAIRQTGADSGHGVLALVNRGASITPDLIIFVFLPALVFESAFAIDVNEFRKNVAGVALLAGPALVLSTVLVALLMIYATGPTWHWGWPAALVFGALISATDPVAVVAIFSELGVSKRLGVLVEGESLLNDGTAIVVFSLLVRMLTGEVTEFSVGEALLRFAVVVSGGVAVGLVLALVLSKWIEEMFNDPLSEITLTLVLAYAAMVIAEGILHVSGVMAVVVAGLWMSATGKRKISPEIQEFLHRFWHMLGYVANTLIFFLVGLVIAKEFESAAFQDFVLIGVVYVGVMIIRTVLTFGFQPLANKVSEGVSSKDSAVITWGGLRGAVSLALALIVAQNENIDPTTRRQILMVTAGVVLLTILVNGTTIGRLLAKLGYDKPPLSEQLATLTARALVLEGVSSEIEEVSKSRDLRAVDWTDVQKRLAERRDKLEDEITAMRDALNTAPETERVAGYWRQVISVERQGYWEAFAHGTLGTIAVRLLTAELDRQLDRMDRGDVAPPDDRTPRIGGGLAGLFGKQPMGFEAVALRYDLWRAQSLAADRVLANLNAIKGCDTATLDSIKSTYQRYLRVAKERIEDMRTNLPEMAQAVETRLANRIQLNFERDGFERLEHRGVLDHSQVHAELHSVEHRMNALRRFAERVEIPETAECVAMMPLFENLDEKSLQELADITEEMILPAGETLFSQGDKGDSLFVIARGAVHVLVDIDGEETLVDVLGGGDVLGEISLLTGVPRTATIRAATSVTLGKISREAFNHLIEGAPALGESVWQAFALRHFDNYVRNSKRFGHLDRDQCLAWARTARPAKVDAGTAVETDESTAYVFVLTGKVRIGSRDVKAVELVECGPGVSVLAVEESRFAMLGRPDEVLAPSTEQEPSAATQAVKDALDA